MQNGLGVNIGYYVVSPYADLPCDERAPARRSPAGLGLRARMLG